MLVLSITAERERKVRSSWCRLVLVSCIMSCALLDHHQPVQNLFMPLLANKRINWLINLCCHVNQDLAFVYEGQKRLLLFCLSSNALSPFPLQFRFCMSFCICHWPVILKDCLGCGKPVMQLRFRWAYSDEH